MPPRFVDSGAFTILDLLDADGGWISAALFVEMIPDIKPKSVRRNLLRARDRGWVESRTRPASDKFDYPENEYRITEAGRRQIDQAVAA